MLFRTRRTTNRHAKTATARTMRASHPSQESRSRSEKDRRGTVLLIALGALGVIALAGLSYVTFVRLDRLGSTTHARVANFQQQVDATTDWIGTLLTADLYGNKIVSNSLPSDNLQFESNANDRVVAWPRRMEDGEFRDYPSTDVRSFNTDLFTDASTNIDDKARLDVMPRSAIFLGNAGAQRFEVATPDDAFLASIDPAWNNTSPDDLQWRSVWPHLTNLRSPYVYVDNADAPENPTPNNLRDDAYVRLDGRYADLGQFFRDHILLGGVRRANGGAFISVVEPGRGLDGGNAPESLNPLAIPFAPLNTLDTPDDPRNADLSFQRLDERFMTDTDGDTYADARWQELDALGSLFGYRWVVAARVIDMSGLVNINSATTANFGADPAAITNVQNRLPSGRTPADVDLFRLFLTSIFDVPGNVWPLSGARYSFNTDAFDGYTPRKDLAVDQLVSESFSNHLAEGIGFYDTVIDQNLAQPSNVIVFNPLNSWIPQSYRDAHYLSVGANPDSPASPGGRRYPVTEMIDLVTFWGQNQQSLISRLEERIDGPLGSQGYLPSPDVPNPVAYGPMEAARPNADSRRFPDAGDMTPRPTANEVRFGTRRLLTTTSGAASFSPVPILNFDAEDPDGRALYLGARDRTKVNLSTLNPTDYTELYETMLWGLAPLAFNEPLVADLTRPERNDINRGARNVLTGARLVTNGEYDPVFHYGGGNEGEAERMLRGSTALLPNIGSNAGLDLVPPGEVKDAGASYAALTALKMTANTIDAFDSDFLPTVIRFLPSNTFSTTASDPGFPFVFDDESTPVLEFGTQTAIGELPSALLDERVTGRPISIALAQQMYFDKEQNITGQPGTALEALNGLDSMSMPDFSDPAQGAGLTLVGLERQPYVTEAFSMAIYSNKGTIDGVSGADGASNIIQPSGARDQAGAIIAFELSNPWPRALPGQLIESLEIWVLNPNSMGELIDDPAAPPLKFRFVSETGGTPAGIIEGDSRVYTFFFGPDDGTKYITGDNGFLNDLFTESPGRLEPLDPAIDPDNGGVPVFFQEYAGRGPRGAGATVVLMRNIPGLERPALIDVLAGPALAEFPAVLDEDTALIGGLPVGPVSSAGGTPIFENYDILTSDTSSEGYDLTRPVVNRLEDTFNPVTVRGRVVVTSSITKPTSEGGSGIGLMPLDLGRSFSAAQGSDPVNMTDEIAHVWVEEISPPDTVMMTPFFDAGIGNLISQIENAVPAITSANIEGTLADTNLDALFPVPAWEVLIPDGDPFSSADIALVSKHAHFCVNHRLNRFDAWRTVGQQLAAEARASGFLSPSLGVLDLASSIPGFADDNGNSYYVRQTNEGTLPSEQFSIPLALRLFDAFEALNPSASGNRFNGRININTATQRVLETLPWIAPGSPFTSQGINATGLRARAMMAYRDGIDPQNTAIDVIDVLRGDPSVFTPDTMTNLSRALLPGANPTLFNVRRPDLAASANGQGETGDIFIGRGFASTAELALLDSWSAADNTVSMIPSTSENPIADSDPSGSFYFGPATTQPGFVREHANDLQNALGGGVFGFDDRDGYTVPQGGQAQRIALYRALANIVETRSDVFGAWFTIRGYDPNVIESIPVDENDVFAAMEDERFQPAYESRWFVLYDRSNVDSPTDSPEILLQVELPSSNP